MGPPVDPVETRFTLPAASKFRGILGADLALGPLHTTLDVSFGRTTSFSAGLGFAY